MKRKLFILEDDPLACMMYEAFFKERFDVDIAQTAAEFLDYFDTNEPDVALIDVNIKDADHTGIDLVARIKERRTDLKSRFILVSAYEINELPKTDFFYSYHQKPVDLQELLNRIEAGFGE